MKTITEEMEKLDELMRKANSLIHPITTHDTIDTILNNKAERDKLKEKFPKCWLPVKMGQPVPFFPVCNRTGMEDPEMISFSLKIANKLVGRDDVDQEHLNGTIGKLRRLHTKYSKEPPKPGGMSAYRKGVTTRVLKAIKRYMETVGK